MIAYLTDVEGMWSKLESFARDNRSVRLDREGRLRVAEGVTFVFGGDAIDRGPDGRRVIDTLLEAKLHDPLHVVLLAGNRDINKLRLFKELSGSPPARAPRELASDRPELLRWIFRHTMGAADAFRFRHEELARGGSPGDADVVESFLDDVRPGGPLERYLSVCQLAFRSGETLFVHGGVLEENFGVVPGRERTQDVDAWVSGLNAFFAEQMAAYAEGKHDDEGRPLWRSLVAYQGPAPGMRVNPESVVYNRLADPSNNPVLPSHSVMCSLRRTGVSRVVLGHTPSGDCPAIVRTAEPSFEMVIADNSHARHDSASRVTITDDAVDVDAEAVLDDGTLERVRYTLRRDDASSPIGRVTADTGHLVQGALTGGRYLLYKALPGFVTQHVAASGESLVRRGLVTPRSA